jgi:hypothetical protein
MISRKEKNQNDFWNNPFREIDSLMDIYRTLLSHLEVHNSKLHIIVHGYDYPLNSTMVIKAGWAAIWLKKEYTGPATGKQLSGSLWIISIEACGG